MAQQTAVEWFIQQISSHIGPTDATEAEDINAYIEQAKQMEKEQIMDAYDNVAIDDNGNFMTAEQYYNDTFKK